MTDYNSLIPLLGKNRVEFIIIGGAAAIAHGAARVTFDLDVVYGRHPENLKKIVEALSDVAPYLRGAPPGLPFEWSVETLKRGLNFTLTTKIGAIDLLGEVVGGGTYEKLKADSIEIEIAGVTCLCVSLEKLIELKKAAGRPKDLEAIAELEEIRSERQ